MIKFSKNRRGMVIKHLEYLNLKQYFTQYKHNLAS